MNKTQRVVLKKQNEVSTGLREAGSHGLSKIACSSRRTKKGTAIFLALAPFSLMAVPQVSSAVLVDNLAKGSSERAQVYSSQVREALSAVAPRASGSGSEGAGRVAAVALSASSLTPDQLIVSGPIDGSTPTVATGTNAVAIGVNAHANGDYSVAAGSYASAATGSVALGAGVSASGSESTALGVRTSVYSDHGLAMGWRTSVNADATDSLAIGSGAQVYSAAAGAIGKDNSVNGAGTYVIGNSNVASGADSFVLGSNVTARGQNSIVLGANSDGSLDNVVSVGDVGSERRIVHVAPGISATDAVNMSQFNALGERANGFVAYDTADKSMVTLGGQPGAPAVALTNLKAGALSVQSSDAVNGAQLNATNTNVQDVAASLATLTRAEPLKLSYTDDSKSNVVLGGTGGTILSNVKAGVADQDAVNVAQLKSAGLIDPTGNTVAAITYDSKADGSVNRSSVTLGGSDAVSPVALHNVAAGAVKAGSTDAVNGDQLFQTAQLVDGLQNGAALKYFVSNTTLAAASASGLNATAIGGNAQAIAGNTVALGANSVADRLNSVSVGAAGNERQITNVQAGTADTDAVNVGQLKSAGLVDQTGKAVTALAYDKNASGATDFGNVTLGQGIAGGTAIHNVAAGTLATDAVNLGQLNDIVSHVSNFVTSSSALYSAAGDTSTEAATASGTHAVAMGANATASAANSVALGAGSLADRASSVSVGAVGSERQITNVAAGTSATDAVNLSQLNQSASSTLNQANSYTDQRFNNTDQQIRDLDRNTRKGIAAASALNVVTPYLPGRTTLNAGVAAYRGQAAMGIGVSRWNDKGNINFNGGVSSSGGNSTIVRAGVGYVFGS
ncbi:YadA family autotransporter adhesin [Caballeronia sp. dw_19]|uniref:YadA family autotransporter adhesin n=1 Tax=Caballeronia sp. dw_19 TaxID=2719791 RepID=UPI00210848BF|nr:YadA family autotransporter adhesin [Caballeronia sp. dw_19]